MNIIREAIAGTLESSDLLVKVGPGQPGQLDIRIRSEVMRQFGARIREVVVETLARLDVRTGDIAIDDKGALDCAIRARLQAAVLRAADAPGTASSAAEIRPPVEDSATATVSFRAMRDAAIFSARGSRVCIVDPERCECIGPVYPTRHARDGARP